MIIQRPPRSNRTDTPFPSTTPFRSRRIDAHRAMPLAALWGDGTTSSRDGQQFHAGGRGAAIGDINARSGNEPGVAFYTHVSDRYAPFARRVIAATAGEAPYVLDGLLYPPTGTRGREPWWARVG